MLGASRDAPVACAGHLTRSGGGALTADLVEFEVKQSFEWLQGSRPEPRRRAAVLILKGAQRRGAAVLIGPRTRAELAANAPTLFNVHVSAFLDHIW
jgi:FKBP12-rapamycin complex-associated protein